MWLAARTIIANRSGVIEVATTAAPVNAAPVEMVGTTRIEGIDEACSMVTTEVASTLGSEVANGTVVDTMTVDGAGAWRDDADGIGAGATGADWIGVDGIGVEGTGVGGTVAGGAELHGRDVAEADVGGGVVGGEVVGGADVDGEDGTGVDEGAELATIEPIAKVGTPTWPSQNSLGQQHLLSPLLTKMHCSSWISTNPIHVAAGQSWWHASSTTKQVSRLAATTMLGPEKPTRITVITVWATNFITWNTIAIANYLCPRTTLAGEKAVSRKAMT